LTPGRALALLVGVATLVWVVLALRVQAPTIFIDELLHAELARNLLDGEWLRVRGERLPISVAYPVMTPACSRRSRRAWTVPRATRSVRDSSSTPGRVCVRSAASRSMSSASMWADCTAAIEKIRQK